MVVHHIITKGTVDEKVMTALKNKDIGQASLMEAIKWHCKDVQTNEVRLLRSKSAEQRIEEVRD